MAKGISLPVVQSGLETSIQQGVKSVGTIKIPATIDPSAFKNLAQPLGRVSGLATEFEKSIAASNARVLAFGASVGIINGVQNAFADLVKTGIEVQKTLADIAAISGKGGKELEKFGDQLFNVGKLTGQSFKTAAQAALEFSRQGLNAEETLKRTTDALTLTRFTSLSAAEAVDVLTAAANSFSETGITTAQIINKLVAVDTKFAVSAEDLANGLARAGSIAQEVGVNFDELNAAITVAQERTARGGAVIGNALKTIFTRIRSDETVNALQEIGVYSRDLQGNLKPATQILSELSVKLKELGGQKRIEVLEAVASKYNINILSALLGDLNDANSKFGQVVQISSQASNEAYVRQIELNKTLAAQVNALTVSVGQLLTKLAEIGVTENLSSLLKFVNGLLDGFNNLLDSEGIGGNIAKGLISGISDVFFKIGLPIIGAIFIKLSRDVAKFALDSLQTILGINQQVRERQALEQAVVNTLVKDQQVMASILSLSGNRAKQEEYLLGIYNRQLAAMQQVQNIASSVTPALMQAGFSATTGQIRKRSAGGYLPGQEASDVRRGVGGASPSSKVVSIPNFAFGGGKRGTMIANTSEYIVPNFANGGSAIFNQDMARAYGLPAGARKISASGGYIPNFAETINADEKYVALVGQKLEPGKSLISQEVRYGIPGEGNNFSISKNKNPNADKILFNVFGVPAQSATGSTLEETKAALEDVGKNLAVKTATAITGGVMPKPEQLAKTRAKFNPGSLSSFAGSIFEASVGALLGDKSFEDVSSQAITSAFDFDLSKDSAIKTAFGIKNQNSKYLEVKGSYKESLMDSVAKKIYQVAKFNREAISTGKIKLQSPTVGERGKNARAFTDKSGTIWLEKANDQFEVAPEKFNLNQYDTRNKKPRDPAKATWGGVRGFVPNFAASPLGDAISREIGAGVLPSQVRVTQDGRLRTAQNPGGLAVINTRDEPNGKIPNFVDTPKVNLTSEGEAFNVKQKKSTKSSVLSTQDIKSLEREINDLLNTYKQDIDKGKDLVKAKEDLAKKTRELTKEYDLDRKSTNRVVGTTQTAASQISPANKPSAEAGLTKFLALQSAVVGVTGAMQSFTDEGSAAAKTFEYAGGALSAAVTGFSLKAAGFGPVGIVVGVATTALATFGPAISKFVSSLETEQERLIAALAKLAEEAEKTGEEITPEKFLAALERGAKQSEGKKRKEKTESDVQKALKEQGIAPLDDKELKAFTLLVQQMGGIENVDFNKIISNRERYLPVGGGMGPARPVKINETVVNMEAATEDAKIAALRKQQENKIETRTSKGKIREAEIRTENALIERRLGVLRNIANIEQSITNEFFQRNQSLEKTSTLLERSKNFLTEGAYAAQQTALEIEKAANQRDESLAKTQGGLASKFDSMGEKGLGSKLAALNQQQLGELLNSYKQEGGITGKGFEEKFAKLVMGGQGDVKQILGRENVANILEQAALEQAAAINNYNNSVTAAQNKLSLFESETQKTNNNIEFLSLVLEGTSGLISNLGKTYDGAAKFTEMTGLETAKLTESVSQLKVKNKLELGIKDKKIQTELDIAKLNKEHTDQMLDEAGLAKRAETDLYKLQEETKKKIDQFKKDAINAADKLKTDTDLLVAENEMLRAFNSAYNGEVRLQSITAKLINARERLIKSEKEKDDQNVIDIDMIRKNYEASINDLQRKIELTRKRNQELEQFDYDRQLNLELQGATEDLIEARRKAAAAFDPENMALATRNQLNSFATQQMNEMSKTMSEGESLRIGGIQSNFSLQAKASIYRQRLAGRDPNNLSPAELEDIVSGRGNTVSQNLSLSRGSLLDETKTINQIIGIDTPKLFATGMADAMQAALNQADNLGEALNGIAQSFLKSLQTAFLQTASNQIVAGLLPKPFATGGLVTGGSGYKDDIPALLTSGEFVMRKSAVQKYGIENLSKMNAGGIFLPGVRGGGNITGYDQLRAFANQTTTSGATDVLRGSGSSAFINLEDQSARLSRFGLLNEDTINQEIRSAQEQGLNIIAEREAYRTQQRKAFQKQLVGTIASAALSYGVGSLASKASVFKPGSYVKSSQTLAGASPFADPNITGKFNSGPTSLGSFFGLWANQTKASPLKAYGGLMRRYAAGGPTDDIPALLMSGEYIMNRGATSKYGKRMLEAMNQGRMSRFADGGEVGSVSENTSTDNGAKMMGDVNISINVTGQGTQTEAQGNTNQGGIDYKKMSERIKAVVLETINEEKRLGGALRSR